MRDPFEPVEQYLVSRGLRHTSARRKILDAVFGSHEHFTAEGLLDKMRRRGERVSRASVYRTLTLLCDGGFVESREFRRLGGTALQSVSCRMVAATHQRLESHAQFRRDLYYRLAGVTITLPPLRERGDDVLLLARHFLAHYAREYRKQLDGFTSEAELLLRRYHWPGNVRELKAAISSAALWGDASPVGVESFGTVQRSAVASLVDPPGTVDSILTIEQLEQRYVTRVLELCGGNKVLTAQKLGISRQTLSRWLADGGEA